MILVYMKANDTPNRRMLNLKVSALQLRKHQKGCNISQQDEIGQ